MKYYLKEEFLHDNNVKNAGNKARNDVEEIVKIKPWFFQLTIGTR